MNMLIAADLMNIDNFLYYYFRFMENGDGGVFSVSIFDRSPCKILNSNGSIYLIANGVPVATVRQISQLTYPQYALAGNIEPAAVIEVRAKDVKAILEERNLWPSRGIVHFSCIDSYGEKLSSAAVFGYPVAINYSVPPSENTARISGRISDNGFLVTGCSWYEALLSVVRQELGKEISIDAPILDWGVGCGRIARYFIEDKYTNITGLDIDSVNVDWCNANLPGGNFLCCDYDPPTEFADDSFQLIYAHSVFTHLGKSAERIWLKELNRLLSPDGIGCVTFTSELGGYLFANSELSKNPSYFLSLWETGRIYLGAQAAGVDIDRPGYYRTVLHTLAYVIEEFGKYINIVRIIPGFANNQDAVVFKKRLGSDV